MLDWSICIISISASTFINICNVSSVASSSRSSFSFSLKTFSTDGHLWWEAGADDYFLLFLRFDLWTRSPISILSSQRFSISKCHVVLVPRSWKMLRRKVRLALTTSSFRWFVGVKTTNVTPIHNFLPKHLTPCKLNIGRISADVENSRNEIICSPYSHFLSWVRETGERVINVVHRSGRWLLTKVWEGEMSGHKWHRSIIQKCVILWVYQISIRDEMG